MRPMVAAKPAADRWLSLSIAKSMAAKPKFFVGWRLVANWVADRFIYYKQQGAALQQADEPGELHFAMFLNTLYSHFTALLKFTCTVHAELLK